MKKFLSVAVLALVAVCGTAASAQKTSGLQGKEAPAFSATSYVLNAPADNCHTLDDCKGDVILIKLWGVNCGPCIRSMPEVNALWGKYGGKGLHVFMLERQSGTDDKIRQIYAPGYKMPQVKEGNFPYPGAGSIPYAYVIGVDGTVIYEGHSGYVSVIDEEVKKIKYMGLGKPDVAKGVEKAAQAFVDKQYAKAIEEANKVIEKNSSEAAVTDAKFVIDRCNAMGQKLRQAADAAKAEKRYLDAFTALETLANGFKGTELGDTAAAEIKELKKDKEVKREVDAANNLAKVIDGLKTVKTKADKVKTLRDFAKKNDGTRAAQDASAKADEIESAE
ncbi:MAG: Thiol-disulfide oxidoreductase ResA [Planctomycetes bacterium]|nr:Thiol-disulfide oxidoreductase ResA [Planctomycetota bacterium]HRJ77520.1 redoxin domain-containing protein [Planctomycetota bacterium]